MSLYIDIRPNSGIMYSKMVKLFDDIQKELDTSFAILGEMYGRSKEYYRLRYRRVKTNLKNKKVIARLPYVAEAYQFEADTDLFKLLVGPLYGYDETFGVRELIQNAIDACLEYEHKCKKLGTPYIPQVQISIDKQKDGSYSFTIKDNGKGMNISEIKNYYLKAGASFRNSTEYKIENHDEDGTPLIRRTGKFGIGVLASFLIGDNIEVVTKRFNSENGFNFQANLASEYIEVNKYDTAPVGTTVSIKISEDTYYKFVNDPQKKFAKWFLLSHPKVIYKISGVSIKTKQEEKIELTDNKQFLDDAVRLDFSGFDDIIWKYSYNENHEKRQIAINGIVIPDNYFSGRKASNIQKTVYNELDDFPFVSILDRNSLIDLELNRN